MQRAASDIATEAKRTRLVCGKGQTGSLTRVGCDRDAVFIYIKSVNHIRADQFDADYIARVYLENCRRIGVLTRLNPKCTLGGRCRVDWQGRKNDHHSRQYDKDSKKPLLLGQRYSLGHIGWTVLAVRFIYIGPDILGALAFLLKPHHVLGDIHADRATQSMRVKSDLPIGVNSLDIAGVIRGMPHRSASTITGDLFHDVRVGRCKLVRLLN